MSWILIINLSWSKQMLLTHTNAHPFRSLFIQGNPMNTRVNMMMYQINHQKNWIEFSKLLDWFLLIFKKKFWFPKCMYWNIENIFKTSFKKNEIYVWEIFCRLKLSQIKGFFRILDFRFILKKWQIFWNVKHFHSRETKVA